MDSSRLIKSELCGVMECPLLKGLVQCYSPCYKPMLDELSACPHRAEYHYHRLLKSARQLYKRREFLDALNQIVFAIHVDVTYSVYTGPDVHSPLLAVTLLKCLIGAGYVDIIERIHHKEYKHFVNLVRLGGHLMPVEKELIEALNNSVMWTDRRLETLWTLNGYIFKQKKEKNVVRPRSDPLLETAPPLESRNRLALIKSYRERAFDLLHDGQCSDGIECVRLTLPLICMEQLDCTLTGRAVGAGLLDEMKAVEATYMIGFLKAADAWCLERIDVLNVVDKKVKKNGSPVPSDDSGSLIPMLRRSDAPMYRKLRCLGVLQARGYCLSFSEKDLVKPRSPEASDNGGTPNTVRNGRASATEEIVKKKTSDDFSSDPRTPEVITEVARANSLYKDGKLQEAVALYTSLLTRLGENYPQKELAIIYYNRGSALLKLAESDFEYVLKINPGHGKAKAKINKIKGPD